MKRTINSLILGILILTSLTISFKSIARYDKREHINLQGSTGTLKVWVNYKKNGSSGDNSLSCQSMTAYELSVSGVNGNQTGEGVFQVFSYPNLLPGNYSISLKVWCNAKTKNECSNCNLTGTIYKTATAVISPNKQTDIYISSLK